jgi:hypothetical protein
MLIQDVQLQHWINHFYGYGSWDARVWFVAYEEGGGDLPEEVADRLNYFYNTHAEPNALCDVRKMYRNVSFKTDGAKSGLFSNLHDHRFDSNAILHGVWKNLIAYVHGYRDKDLPDILSYQRMHFASTTEKEEALIKLFPLPSPHNHAWYYSWLDIQGFDFLKSRTLYERHLYPTRIGLILNKIHIHKPEVVLMYGMNNINAIKKSVQEFFPGAKFKMAKAIKQQIPQHHSSDINGTKLIITTQIPALRHNRVETGFNWEEFGKLGRQRT